MCRCGASKRAKRDVGDAHPVTVPKTTIRQPKFRPMQVQFGLIILPILPKQPPQRMDRRHHLSFVSVVTPLRLEPVTAYDGIGRKVSPVFYTRFVILTLSSLSGCWHPAPRNGCTSSNTTRRFDCHGAVWTEWAVRGGYMRRVPRDCKRGRTELRFTNFAHPHVDRVLLGQKGCL